MIKDSRAILFRTTRLFCYSETRWDTGPVPVSPSNGIGAMAGANLLWAEAGSNPRDTEESTVRGCTVKQIREMYREAGWEVLEGPSVMYAG